MGPEGPAEATVADNQWETVLAELQGDGEGLKGLDRLASLDFVSDLLSSEGFEGFKTPGSEERKLTRLASLELLTELFEGEGLADSGFDVPDELLTPLEEGSGISNDWTDDDLLAALGSSEEELAQKHGGSNECATGESTARQANAEVNRRPNAGWGPEVSGNNWGGFECVSSENGGPRHEEGASNCDASRQRSDKKKNSASACGNTSLKAPTSGAHQAFLPPLQIPGHAPAGPSFPPPSKGSAPSEEAPPAGPRMRFTPQQQMALYDFGARVSWVAPGIETIQEAHRLCEEFGMDMRQLKKWISNHRPKELRLPITRPPWSAPEGRVPPRYGPYPPLSPAALASLAAAQAAVMGQPFSGPFDIPPGPVVDYPPPSGSVVNYPPLPGHWPQVQRPFGGEAFNMGGAPQLPYLMDGGYQRSGALRFRGGSGSSVASMGSQNEGEGGRGSVPEVKGVLASEGMKKVLRRKLKDFDPAKVQQLVELCTDYRRKRALLKVGGGLSEGPEPPNKKQRTNALDFHSPGGLLNQPLIPPRFPPGFECQNPPNLPSESGENSELTECEKPADAMDASKAPNSELPGVASPDPLNLPNPEPPIVPTQEASAAPPDSCRPGWETGPFGGHSLSTLPSFPSIDLSKWGLEDFTGRISADLGGQVDADVTGAAGADVTGGVSADLTRPADPEGPGTAQRLGSCTGGSSMLDRVPNGHEWAGAPLHRTPGEASDSVRPPSARGGRSSRGGKGQKQLPGCKFLFEKALTASDTSSLGRIIIPKVHAELHLPRVADKESCTVTVSDADGLMWELKYRFWFNNKSRIYLLEHAADLIQARGLVPGDSILFYQADDGRLIMLERKAAFLSKGDERPAAGASGRDPFQGISEAAFEGGSDSEAFNAGRYTDSQAVEVDRMLLQMYDRA